MQQKKTSLKKQASQVARLLKFMANPQRLLLLCLLTEKPHSVGELQAVVGLSQSALSQHLAQLRAYKVVLSEVKGPQRLYRLADDKVAQILQLLHQLYCSKEK
jgi:DNA-binding transcriptional ArsR family regulator